METKSIMDWKDNFISSLNNLEKQLMQLRPQMIAAAQKIYDEWDQTDEYDPVGGICDEVANVISDVIASNISDIELADGGHEGDDHAYVVVYNDSEAFSVDIPYYIYESGGGYVWKKIPDVIFNVNNVEIHPIDREFLD